MSGRNVARTKDPSLQQTSDVNIERIIIDISDYVQFMVRAGSVSGIQRVVAAIANEETDPERIVFCVRAKKAFWYIPYDKGMKPIEAIQSFIDYRRALLLC